jgi:hypothetical protein
VAAQNLANFITNLEVKPEVEQPSWRARRGAANRIPSRAGRRARFDRAPREHEKHG